MCLAEEIVYFETPAAFRDWLRTHHGKKDELWVGYYKKETGVASMTWPESVDEALCFGWIDGLRKSVDSRRYKIRFTPRRQKSNWSVVNLERVKVLTREGRMEAPGLAAFRNRKHGRDVPYSYEMSELSLKDDYVKEFKRNRKAWAFFQRLAPSYRKVSIRYVMSAKREETRQKRLRLLVESSESGQKIPQLTIGRKKS